MPLKTNCPQRWLLSLRAVLSEENADYYYTQPIKAGMNRG
jgi:hypothetical protein